MARRLVASVVFGGAAMAIGFLAGPGALASAGATQRISANPTAPTVEKGGVVRVRYAIAKGIDGVDLKVDGDGLRIAPLDGRCTTSTRERTRELRLDVTAKLRPAVSTVCVYASKKAAAGTLTALGSDGTLLETKISVTPAAMPPTPCSIAVELDDAGADAEAKAVIIADAKEHGLGDCAETLKGLTAEPWPKKLEDWVGDYIVPILKVLGAVIGLTLVVCAWRRGRRPSLIFKEFGDPEGNAKPATAFKASIASLFSSGDIGVEDLPIASISQVDQNLDLAGLTKQLDALAPELSKVSALIGLIEAVVPARRYEISGQLQTNPERGAGVTLVATRKGSVFASDTLWLGTPASEAAKADPYATLALAAAAWARYAVAGTTTNRAKLLTTPTSYAWLCVGLAAQGESRYVEAKRLFDRSLDAHPKNFRAVAARALLDAKKVAAGPPPDHPSAIAVLDDALAQIEAAIGVTDAQATSQDEAEAEIDQAKDALQGAGQ